MAQEREVLVSSSAPLTSRVGQSGRCGEKRNRHFYNMIFPKEKIDIF
jgi:hypothetical protein